MNTAKVEVLAFTTFPREHWRKALVHQPLERRLNREIKRRSRVLGIFPNAAAVVRPVRSGPDRHPGRRIAGDRLYFSEGSMAKLYGTSDTDPVAAI